MVWKWFEAEEEFPILTRTMEERRFKRRVGGRKKPGSRLQWLSFADIVQRLATYTNAALKRRRLQAPP